MPDSRHMAGFDVDLPQPDISSRGDNSVLGGDSAPY